MLHALDDWIFSRDFVHGRRPDLEARLDRFADALLIKAREAALDEIVIVGHSMGASLAVEIVARALARDPELGRHGPTVCVLTVGSTIPKFTLHPAAEHIRRAAAAVAAAPSIAWAEYQARDDAISFYKFDPVTGSHVGSIRLDNKPVIRRVQMHDMLERRTFWRSRMKFMRLHYQFVLANERRAIYDYFMTVCGPLAFEHAILAPGGAAGLITVDGALIDQRPAGPALAA
jgi:pimeloyl-ACP methyl ester carboxylesterase